MRSIPLSVLFLFQFIVAQGQIAENVFKLAQWDGSNIPWNGGGAKYNEVWGFVHEGMEYGVIGSTNGAHIISLPEDNAIQLVDYVPGAFMGSDVVHRDYHDYKGYLYAVCQQGDLESSLQIMDLQYLPDSVHVVYDSNAEFAVAHNIFIDTTKAKLYVCLPAPSPYAMTVYSLADPLNPVFEYGYDTHPSVHDVFVRNDTAWLNCAEDGLWVYDFSNTANPQLLGSLEFYEDKGYNHSGWLSEDGQYYVFTDETVGMRMKYCDVSDLTDIKVLSLFNSEFHPQTVPHNVMLKDGICYVSHYSDGLQIFNMRDPKKPKKIGYYDTYTTGDIPGFMGAWGIYAFLPSGRLLISDRQTGFYVFGFLPPPWIRTTLEHGMFPNPMSERGVLYFDNPFDHEFELKIYDTRGRLVRHLTDLTSDSAYVDRLGLRSGLYVYRLLGVSTSFDETGKFVIARTD